MFNLVLFGPPGAGKGTQSEKIIQKYRLVHLSTGDILRAELKAQTPLGQEAKKYMDKGELVPDELVIRMIESKVDKNRHANGFIFDGFPRTTAQAQALDTLLKKKGLSITLMLSLEVEHQELVKRLLGRGKDSGRADDQDMSIIENRISVYHKETAPVIDFYASQGKHVGIQGIGPINDIFDLLCKAIDNK